MNLLRIIPIATNVFREVIRDRVLYLVGLFALLMVAAMQLLPEVASVASNKIVVDVGLGTIALLSLIVTLFVGTGLVNKEIEKRTVLVLMAKPMSRAEFIVGKHLGLTAVLGVLIGAMGLIYLGLLMASRIPVPIGSICLSLVFLWLEMSLVTAVALLFGVASSSLLATLLTVGIYLMGHSSRDLVKLAKLSENPGLQKAIETLYLILPDLERFNSRNEAVYNALPSPASLGQTAVYGVLYTVLLLTGTIVIFSRRQF
jgi:ABC-type transport system involved in multi-copper enzyme maturation permease subunit